MNVLNNFLIFFIRVLGVNVLHFTEEKKTTYLYFINISNKH